MRVLAVLLPVGIGLVLVPGFAHAQAERECLIESDSFQRTMVGPDREMDQFYGSVRIQCDDGLRINADSAVSYPWINEVQLSGNVVYEDSLRVLRARFLNHQGQRDRVVANLDVVYTDKASGMVINGDQLEHLMASATQPESRTIVTGRPNAVFPPDEADRAAGAPPSNVTADRMEIFGDRLFRAVGNAMITRGESSGRGNELEFHIAEDRLVLRGDPAEFVDAGTTVRGMSIDVQLEGGSLRELAAHGLASMASDSLTIAGDSVRARMDDSGRPANVFASGDAFATAEGVLVDTDRITLSFADGELSTLTAVAQPRTGGEAGTPAAALSAYAPRSPARAQQLPRPSPPPGSTPPATLLTTIGRESASLGARVLADGFSMFGDSIDIVASCGRVRTASATGRALARSLATDPEPAASDVAPEPSSPDSLPGTGAARDSLALQAQALIAHDWVAGDTVIAQFAPPATADTGAEPSSEPCAIAEREGARQELVLERLSAAAGEGTLARALYRMADENAPDGDAIHYLVSSRLDILLRNGEVVTVDAADPVHGMSLQAGDAPAPTGRGRP